PGVFQGFAKGIEIPSAKRRREGGRHASRFPPRIGRREDAEEGAFVSHGKRGLYPSNRVLETLDINLVTGYPKGGAVAGSRKGFSGPPKPLQPRRNRVPHIGS